MHNTRSSGKKALITPIKGKTLIIRVEILVWTINLAFIVARVVNKNVAKTKISFLTFLNMYNYLI